MENLILLFLKMDRFGSERMWLMPIFCIAICLIVFLVFRRSGKGPFFFDRTRQKDNLDNDNSSAIDILNNRYAKGEISKEEYDRMKKDIS